MMGVQEAPARLFYDFDLDAHVPANHILRQICQRRSKNRPCGGANVGHLRVPESGTRNAEGAQVPALSI